MSVFIELGVPIIVKQVNKWIITCCVVSPREDVAHIKEEFLLIEICKREKVQGNELHPFAIVHWDHKESDTTE